MPGLPDVERFREGLASCAQGKRIKRVDVHDAAVKTRAEPHPPVDTWHKTCAFATRTQRRLT
ncbi:DNA-formamidopyrimidine glycosylase family protein [Streptomyces sp. NPDC057460]|uniref:DNA-formamidopyrimidine glycosylase family protein n=1 Tax=Streptomyces sp. NPDC057460 TaxID=3346141 RepID=UPI0036BEB39B